MQGFDGGVIESWGSSANNTWEYNAVHDNEGYADLSLMFADDFTPELSMRKNVLFANNCPTAKGANCAVFMMKSISIEAEDNIVWRPLLSLSLALPPPLGMTSNDREC